MRCLALLCAAAFVPAACGQTERVYPAFAHELVAGSSVVVLGPGDLRAAVATATSVGELQAGDPLGPGAWANDGALANEGDKPVHLWAVSRGPIILEPGYVLIVVPAGGYTDGGDGVLMLANNPYGRTCLCRCGTGDVSVPPSGGAGSVVNATACSRMNGQGPCLDPITHKRVDAGFSNCVPGWGPVSTK